MRFSEDGICELSSITSIDECRAYGYFLAGEEHDRHEAGVAMARFMADKARGTATLAEAVFWNAVGALRDSAALRHQQDLDGITKRIKEIEAHKATLEVK